MWGSKAQNTGTKGLNSNIWLNTLHISTLLISTIQNLSSETSFKDSTGMYSSNCWKPRWVKDLHILRDSCRASLMSRVGYNITCLNPRWRKQLKICSTLAVGVAAKEIYTEKGTQWNYVMTITRYMEDIAEDTPTAVPPLRTLEVAMLQGGPLIHKWATKEVLEAQLQQMLQMGLRMGIPESWQHSYRVFFVNASQCCSTPKLLLRTQMILKPKK